MASCAPSSADRAMVHKHWELIAMLVLLSFCVFFSSLSCLFCLLFLFLGLVRLSTELGLSPDSDTYIPSYILWDSIIGFAKFRLVGVEGWHDFFKWVLANNGQLGSKIESMSSQNKNNQTPKTTTPKTTTPTTKTNKNQKTKNHPSQAIQTRGWDLIIHPSPNNQAPWVGR